MFGTSYAHRSLVLSSFNTIDFAQNAEGYDDPRSHEHAHALVNTPTHRHLEAKTQRPTHAQTHMFGREPVDIMPAIVFRTTCDNKTANESWQ